MGMARFATTGRHALLDHTDLGRPDQVPAITVGAPGVMLGSFNTNWLGHAGILYVRPDVQLIFRKSNGSPPAQQAGTHCFCGTLLITAPASASDVGEWRPQATRRSSGPPVGRP